MCLWILAPFDWLHGLLLPCMNCCLQKSPASTIIKVLRVWFLMLNIFLHATIFILNKKPAEYLMSCGFISLILKINYLRFLHRIIPKLHLHFVVCIIEIHYRMCEKIDLDFLLENILCC